MGDLESLIIVWRDQEVGIISNPVPDMWYLEGNWLSNKSKLSEEFELKADGLKSKEVMLDNTKGLRVQLVDKKSNTIIHSLVILLEDNLIYIRRFIEKKEIEWLLANVR